MKFEHSDKVEALRTRLTGFLDVNVAPLEPAWRTFCEDPANRWVEPPMLADLKSKARAAGLWNLFLPPEYGEISPGLTNLEYAPLAEAMGWYEFASEVFNCSAPDTGNMEVLARYGTPAQKAQWLDPLLDGSIRSSFLMTEPAVASSDATNIECSIVRSGDEYVINGRKWWSTGVLHPRTEILVVMGKTDPNAPKHRQQSMILVPKSTPGVEIVRPLAVFGSVHSPGGHGEVTLTDVRVPVDNRLLGEGRGFEIAQGRLGPGRVHHCMRLIGAAQRALTLACQRASTRVAFGKPLAAQGSVRETVARARCAIEQARLLTFAAADKMDRAGNKAAKDLIAMIKIVVPRMAQRVIDDAIQIHGGLGVCDDVPLTALYSYARIVRLADGPDEVHLAQLGKATLVGLGGTPGTPD